jgi:hypothetical protein
MTTMKSLIFVGLVALGAIGCGDSNNVMNNPTPDLAMQGQPDMAPTCFAGTPATNEEFLNACTTSASVDLVPFYPDNAPNGTLPPLQ